MFQHDWNRNSRSHCSNVHHLLSPMAFIDPPKWAFQSVGQPEANQCCPTVWLMDNSANQRLGYHHMVCDWLIDWLTAQPGWGVWGHSLPTKQGLARPQPHTQRCCLGTLFSPNLWQSLGWLSSLPRGFPCHPRTMAFLVLESSPGCIYRVQLLGIKHRSFQTVLKW